MTKGKKWTLRLLGVAALALLICLCLLGSTMARYTSQGTGSGSLTVALWDLESEKVTIEDESVSPSMAEYSSTSARTNQSAWMQCLTMVNNSAVDADVTVTLAEDADGNANISMEFDDYFTWGVGWDSSKYTGQDDADKYTARSQTNEYASELMDKFGFTTSESDDEAKNKDYQSQFISLVNTAGIFSLQLADNEEGTSASDTLTISGIEADGGTADVYCEVVWTSICQTNATVNKPDGFTDWEEFSDAVDTILGMYVTELSFEVTWTATQASTLPPENP